MGDRRLGAVTQPISEAAPNDFGLRLPTLPFPRSTLLRSSGLASTLPDVERRANRAIAGVEDENRRGVSAALAGMASAAPVASPLWPSSIVALERMSTGLSRRTGVQAEDAGEAPALPACAMIE
jgi:hypothetical protein